MAQSEDQGESLRITEVGKHYGSVTALDRVSLSVRRGEFLTILGPSGSGKTTLLKIIAGFEQASRGSVHLEGRDVTRLRPAARGIGMVFQHYALFPHMTVAQNVAFPLRMRKAAKPDIARRVAEALALVELTGFEDRLPAQLSGGQQQRVALARAISFDPPLLLLDEPFGALDRKLREQMQLEVKGLQRRLGLTAVFVTHDQEEALLMSDRIAVMADGVIHQLASPEAIYAEPCNRFVADFIGESNIYAAEVIAQVGDRVRLRLDEGLELEASGSGYEAGTAVHAVIRPESPMPAADTRQNRLALTVVETIFTGGSRKYRLRGADGFELSVRWPNGGAGRDLAAGESVELGVPPTAIRLVR